MKFFVLPALVLTVALTGCTVNVTNPEAPVSSPEPAPTLSAEPSPSFSSEPSPSSSESVLSSDSSGKSEGTLVLEKAVKDFYTTYTSTISVFVQGSWENANDEQRDASVSAGLAAAIFEEFSDVMSSNEKVTTEVKTVTNGDITFSFSGSSDSNPGYIAISASNGINSYCADLTMPTGPETVVEYSRAAAETVASGKATTGGVCLFD